MKAKISIRVVQQLTPQPKPYEIVDTELKGFILRVQPSGVMNYYFSYRNSEGTKKRYRIGEHGKLTPVQARDIALKLSARIIGGEDIQELKKLEKQVAVQAKERTLNRFLTNYYKEWVLNERKTGLATYKRILSNFETFMDTPLEKIDHWSIEKWRSAQLKSGKQSTTINRDVTALKAVFSKAIQWNVLSENPLEKLKPIKTDKNGVIRYLSPTEERKLRQALIDRENHMRILRDNANKWRAKRGYELYADLNSQFFVDYLHPIVILAMNTGLRRGEIFQLMWSDINFDAAVLTVRGLTAKSGKTRHIPLNQEALSVLQKWQIQQQNNLLIFPGKEGCAFNNINKSWKGLMNASEINNFRFHDLRHHFASKLVMLSVDLNTVRELLGHSDISMTLRYAHLAPEHKANAVAKLVGEMNVVY